MTEYSAGGCDWLARAGELDGGSAWDMCGAVPCELCAASVLAGLGGAELASLSLGRAGLRPRRGVLGTGSARWPVGDTRKQMSRLCSAIMGTLLVAHRKMHLEG